MSLKLKQGKDGVYVPVKILPASKVNQIAGLHGESLKIKIKAQAKGGRANKELIGFLSKHLSVSRSCIKIVKGERSSSKLIFIERLTIENTRLLLEL